jgi:hypothetical protein
MLGTSRGKVEKTGVSCREWDEFMQRRARGEGTLELCEAWSAYKSVTDVLYSDALERREERRESDEQSIRTGNAFGYLFITMGLLVLFFFVTCPPSNADDEGCLFDFTWQMKLATPFVLLAMFCMFKKGKPTSQLQQEQHARMQQARQHATPWAASDHSVVGQPVVAAAPIVTVQCPPCQNAFQVQRPAAAAAAATSLGVVVVQCPRCHTQLQL